jgi:para-nitrobenzyl esterase
VSLLKDVVVVAANYRLGVLGFLAGDELRAESADGSVGTYGSQDQRAALEFLRDSAAAFGGDPSRVLIFGQSAGAASVSQLLVNPRAAGLFSRAIIESGAFSTWTAQPYNISKTRLPQFAKNVGCGGASGAALLACLRAVNASEVLKGDKGLTSGFLEWSPAVDGVEILDDPRVLLAAGKAHDVPVMVGFNKDEGTMFAKAPKDLNESGYVAAISEFLPRNQSEVVAKEYPCSDFRADLGQSACWWGVCELERDSMFACPVQKTAAALSAAARANGGNVFAYLYTHVLFIVDIVDLFKPYRCFHGSELPLVFDLWPAMFGVGEADLATWFATSWTTFAATGNPNYEGAPAVWPAFRAANETLMVDTGAKGVNLTAFPNLLAEKCAFWAANPVGEAVIWG